MLSDACLCVDVSQVLGGRETNWLSCSNNHVYLTWWTCFCVCVFVFSCQLNYLLFQGMCERHIYLYCTRSTDHLTCRNVKIIQAYNLLVCVDIVEIGLPRMCVPWSIPTDIHVDSILHYSAQTLKTIILRAREKCLRCESNCWHYILGRLAPLLHSYWGGIAGRIQITHT